MATRRWTLLVFDPAERGARAADVFREAAERFGWIVAASENSRNGPWEPTLRAMNAMWPALLGGYAVDERRVYTAGHSGGATVAWFGAAGHSDFNFIEVKGIDARLARGGGAHRVESARRSLALVRVQLSTLIRDPGDRHPFYLFSFSLHQRTTRSFAIEQRSMKTTNAA